MLIPFLIIALLLCIAFSGAVLLHFSKRNQKTTNAMGCAFIRLMLTHFPGPLNLDRTERPFALSILSTNFTILYAFIRVVISIIGANALKNIVLRVDSVKLGIFAYISSRVMLFDRFFVRSIVDYEVEQFVILGAGFDSRAYRYANLRRKNSGKLVQVYEVDLPEVQGAKRAVVRRLTEDKSVGCFRSLLAGHQEIPAHCTEGVHYVSCDFESENLVQCLLRAGLNPRLKTAVSWEGVTPYLEPEAVKETLKSISEIIGFTEFKETDPDTPPSTSTAATPNTARSASDICEISADKPLLTNEAHLDSIVTPTALTSGSNSTPVFEAARLYLLVDYVNIAHFHDKTGGVGAQLIRGMAKNNTPFKSGLDPDRLESYLRLNGGFEVRKHFSPTHLTTEFLPDWNKILKDSDWAYVVETFL
eukprot:Selendium_serpulae@DN5561_c0_g1_i1.p1